MLEDFVCDMLKEQGIEFIVSLPCDRTKDLCALMEAGFHYVNINREEDGAGVCAGLALAKRRFVLQMQSSGLGNSLNAMMSLTELYKMPLPVIASWRGYYKEKIPAQIPFNSKIPRILDALEIKYTIISEPDELVKLKDVIEDAYENSRIHVALISPKVWEGESCKCPVRIVPDRKREIHIEYTREIHEPVMKRADAIGVAAELLKNELTVSNIGVPSKELYAANDRPENFYMLGSYTQATPIGLGLAVGQDRDVIVLDGDGSLLGTAIMPAVAAENPKNLTIVALDNGAFGSTGSQQTHAWTGCDLELMAIGAGIKDTFKANSEEDLKEALLKRTNGPKFIHVILKPGNTDAPNIKTGPEEIKKRFQDSFL
ncbi:sulfopyruvate decarboxylase subunit beta [Methanoplanus sp. FWC-SCC4]|uniref:sulfopyruvate decarboxylase n=1 Tax=Methanochimaera problematica TaxID=2609417 RepID=A0AA97FEX0_9EURY|nr:sulfopyruvate decarboxylase subunit beta [Methanoplanus sp. FWC-SCC4]WOF16939.1 sulfopyruvate decarboxylase subunit beta [Methanoplanus sp. FWC-SCC4]